MMLSRLLLGSQGSYRDALAFETLEEAYSPEANPTLERSGLAITSESLPKGGHRPTQRGGVSRPGCCIIRDTQVETSGQPV